MRVLASALLAVSPALAYQITYPGSSGGWNTSGPNQLLWQHVATDPPKFAAVLVNQNTGYQTVLEDDLDGTLDVYTCDTPSGGWPFGPDFQVNMAADSEHLNTLLTQSSNFSILAVASNGSTTRTADLLVVIAALMTTLVTTLL